MARWTFRDLNLSTTYEFAISPNATSPVSFERRVTKTPTVAATGKVVLFEGRRAAPPMDFAGVVLDQASKTALDTWWSKRRVVELTDDLGRVSNIYITSLTWERAPTAAHPWRHRFTVQAIVTSGGSTVSSAASAAAGPALLTTQSVSLVAIQPATTIPATPTPARITATVALAQPTVNPGATNGHFSGRDGKTIRSGVTNR